MEQSSFGFVRHQNEKIRRALELLQHPDLPLNEPVSSLSIGLQQVVEIARALMSDARVIIMDEPTSSLTAADTEALFKVIGRLRETGVAVVYISHFLEEVTEIADTFTVLRDGKAVGTGRIADTDISQIIEMMVGRTLKEMFPRTEHEIGEVVLKVEGVEGSPIPRGVSFELRRGEILGIAGLVGAGRSETLRRMFGLDRATAGTLTLTGRASIKLNAMNPSRALAMKIDFLSEDRKEEGLAVRMSVAENTTLSSVSQYARFGGWGLLNPRTERFAVEQWIDAMRIQCLGPNQRVLDLSGGNQQKVALARMLQQGGGIVLLDEPTKGIDVGSKVEVYRLIGRLAAQGRGIVFVSSYLPELLGICDTLAVMHRGLMSDIKPIDEWTEHDIMRVATSGN
jgi:ribose transport system ATP-binding protein